MNYCLKPGTYILTKAEDLVYICGKTAKLKVRLPGKYRRKVIDLLVKGVNFEALSKVTDSVIAKTLFDMLFAKSLVRSVYSPVKERTALEKTETYLLQYCENPALALDRLAAAHIAVVGLGGIGCILVEQLLACGVKNFTCIDFDRVSVTNLNRQFCFTPGSVGRSKTGEIRKYIMARSPGAKVNIINFRITNQARFNSIMAQASSTTPVSFVACCADMPVNTINAVVATYCLKKNLPCSFCGVGIYDGSVGPLLSSGDEKKRYLDFIAKAEKVKMYPSVTPGSVGFTNSLIGVLFAKDIAMSIAGIENFRSRAAIVSMDFDDLSVMTVKTFN